MSRRLALAILAAVAIAIYWNALDAPFVWDDDIAITANQSIHEIGTSLNPPVETPVAARPIANLSLALNYGWGGLDPRGYHVVNLAILIACALLLFGIVRRTLQRQLKGAKESSLNAIAFAPALLWTVHPLLSETVDYTTQRTESLMALFFLLTLYWSIRRFNGLAFAACALGMATKESMVVAPVAVVLYDVVFDYHSIGKAFAKRKLFYTALAATWIELAVIILHWPRSTVGGTAVSPVTYALNQAQLIARYLGLTFWPRSLVVDYGLPRALHLADVLPQALLIVALAGITAVALVRWPAAGFLGAMFFLTLAPTSSVVPIVSEVGAERRMFLPLAALSILVVLGAIRFERLIPRKAAIAVLAVVVAALGARTVYRNRDYQSSLDLWRTVVERRPQGRARFAYGTQLMEAGDHEHAIEQLRLAVTDTPDARAGLGTELLLHGNLDEGIKVLQAFVDDAPSLPNRIPAKALLAQAHQAIGERALSAKDAHTAAAEARKAVDLAPDSADAHNLLGAALASQGDLRGAIPEFRTAVKLNPKDGVALKNLAQATAMVR